MLRVKTSFAYIIKINKIICIKVCARSSAPAEWGVLGNTFVRWGRDGWEENDFTDIGRHSWNGMLCFFRLLNPWMFTVLGQTWAIKTPGKPLRGVRWLWQLLWVGSDDQVVFSVKSRMLLVWSKLGRIPSDLLWIFITHIFHLSASWISLWCDSILLMSVACTGTSLIYSARWESGTVAWYAAWLGFSGISHPQHGK